MMLGLGSYTFAWAIGVPGHPPERPMNAFDLLDEAARLDVQLVQICDNLPLTQFSSAELGRFATRAEELKCDDLELMSLCIQRGRELMKHRRGAL